MNPKKTLRWTQRDSSKPVYGQLPAHVIKNLDGEQLGDIFMVVFTTPITGEDLGQQISWNVDVDDQSFFGDAPTVEAAKKRVEDILLARGYSMLPEKFKHFE